MDGTWTSTDQTLEGQILEPRLVKTNGRSPELTGYMYVGDSRDRKLKLLMQSYGPWRVVTNASQMHWPPPRAILFGKEWKAYPDKDRIRGCAMRLSGMYGTEVETKWL